MLKAMKNNMLVNTAIVCGMLLSAATGAAVAKPSGAGKYGVVDMQTVILNVSEGKAARATLEKEIKAKEAELQAAKTELDKMNQDWKSQAPLLSESARLTKQQEFQEKFLGLRNQEMTFQAEIKRKEQKATQDIAVSVTKLVSKMGQDRGFEMVFETSSAGLIYLKDPVDLTDEVIKAYEATSKKTNDPKTAKKAK